MGASGDLITCNLFAYSLNNPLLLSDPSGEFAITTAILIGSAVLGVAAAVYTGYKMRQAGENWGDTAFYSIGAGICVFGTVYTLGISAYEFYCNMCWYYGYTPATHIGNPERQLQRAADIANESIPGKGHVVGTKKHTIFSQEIHDAKNSRLKTEISFKDGVIVKRGTEGSIRFDAVLFDASGCPIKAWDFKTGSAVLSQSRISTMLTRSGLSIPIVMIK